MFPGTLPRPAGQANGAQERLLAWVPVLASMLFTAVTLLPELRPVPSLNDDAFHFLLVQEASDALRRGENITDFWSPVLELGFPQFLYYQHLPHLFVVLLDRLTMGGVGLITCFNAVRYLLLVGFPLTVYWSLRRLGFSPPGAALAAALSPLFSGSFNYGFEYDSYLWRGLGMYTQLWAMHLSLLSLALLATYLDRGEGLLPAVAAVSALILSHLVYAYMTGISALFVLLWGMRAANARGRLLRFALLWAAAALVTAYFWLPVLLSKEYLSASPYLERWKYDSFGAAVVLRRLVTGTLLDHSRLPVVTILVLAGFVASLLVRSRDSLRAAAFFALWLALYFGRATWGPLADLLPMSEGLIMHRFVGGVHMAALMLIAAGGDRLWESAGRAGRRQAALFTVLALVIMLPALVERHAFYRLNDAYLRRTGAALAADADAGAIIARLNSLPAGRTFAGLRSGWGKEMKIGDLSFSDLLTFNRIPAVSAPYQALSLNSDLLWDFDHRNRSDYDVFNVRYVVAPSAEPMPEFLELLERRGRYALYQASAGGYFAVGRSEIAFSGRQSELLPAARSWLRSRLVAAREFPQVRLKGMAAAPSDSRALPLSDAVRRLAALAGRPPPAGRVLAETAVPQSHAASVLLEEAATVVLKVTYHPNWRATVNGADVPTMMVMPSFIGIALPPGRHDISLVYRSDPRRVLLAAAGAALLVLATALAVYRRLRRRVRERD
jgi:hypothetical protein